MKKYFIFAASALALAGCSSDDFGGEKAPLRKSDVINFDGGANKITRAQSTGAKAANLLGNKFVLVGGKEANEFNYYNVVWNNNAGQTQSNTAGWEYVGQEKNPLNELAGDQAIKYWDYSANQYNFIAFSFGDATQKTGDSDTDESHVEASKVTNDTYTLTGKADELKKCYIADRVTAEKNVSAGDKKANKLIAYGDQVQFNFRSLVSKVKMGIYETIPGYSIGKVYFYSKADDSNVKNNTDPVLYAAGNNIPAKKGKGTMTVTFGTNTDKAATDYNQAKVAWASDQSTPDVSTITFGTLSTTTKEDSEDKTEDSFIGRDLANASMPEDYSTVLPAAVGPLTLKVDYVLYPTDGAKSTITIKGANAVIPAEYTNWKPNYAYTYIFKISDQTNGFTGDETDPSGLYPITFDAVATATEDGLQNTITTVNAPSITTYAKGEYGKEYKVNDNIYVKLSDNIALATDNAALYTAEMTKGTSPITEAYAALCLKDTKTNVDGPWTLDDGTNALTITKATGLSFVDEIAAADVADGNAIKGNFAKFTPTAAGTYVFEFTKTIPAAEEGGTATTAKFYKVIVVTD